MRVCLINRYWDFRGTGVTRIATAVGTELERRGHRVLRVATDGDSLYAYAWKTAITMPVKLPRCRVDVYHALATLEAMWLPKRKSIATILDLFTTTNPDRAGAGMGYSRWKLEMGRRYFDWGSKLASRCRYIVTISDKTKHDIITHVCKDESRIKVIRLGIREDLTPAPHNGNGRLTIGTLGQLDKRKRIDLLIRQFCASKIDARLLIAGVGRDEPMLRDLAGNDSRITFLGLVPDHALAWFYNSLDLFVFPTAIEGYGLPIVEAMACRKPVMIVSDAIIPEDVRRGCVPVTNMAEVFDSPARLDEVMRAPDYDANLRFAAEHRWGKCVDEYLALYKAITEENE